MRTLTIRRPSNVDADEHWPTRITDAFWKDIPKNEQTWDRKYDTESRRELSSMVQRLFESMLYDSENFEYRKIKDVDTHGHLRLTRVPYDKLVSRGDLRYGSGDLAEVVKSGKDLVPIAIGADSEKGPFRILDGHHRSRAYALANRPVLGFVGWVDKKGAPGEITFSSDNAPQKTNLFLVLATITGVVISAVVLQRWLKNASKETVAGSARSSVYLRGVDAQISCVQ